ncbi:unnamed protein product [Hanseniaspora opuntiae]
MSFDSNKIYILDSGQGSFLESKGVNITENNLWGSGPFIKPGFFSDENHPDRLAILSMYDEFCKYANFISIPTYQMSLSVYLEVTKKEKSLESVNEYKALIDQITEFTYENTKETTSRKGDIFGRFFRSLKEYFKDQLEVYNSKENKADIIGFETIPNFDELKFLLELDEETVSKPYYVSLSCKDDCELELRDGTKLEDVAKYIKEAHDQGKVNKNIKFIGVNCCSFYSSLPNISELNKHLNDDRLRYKFVVYPNSGEVFNVVDKTWSEPSNIKYSSTHNWKSTIKKYVENNCQLIGGCCRTTPKDLKIIEEAVKELN